MSSEALRKAHSIRGLKPAVKQLLVHLGYKHRWGVPLVQTYQQLEDALETSERTICRYLKMLESVGHIRRSQLQTPGKNHLVDIELTFLDGEEARKPRHKPAPNWRRIPSQNGAPLYIEENNPSKSLGTDGEVVDFRLEPEVFKKCCQALGAHDWEAKAETAPVRIFLRKIVAKAREC